MRKIILSTKEYEVMMHRAIEARRDGIYLSEVFRRFSQLQKEDIRARLKDAGLLGTGRRLKVSSITPTKKDRYEES